MTSKQVQKAYKAATRAPRISRAEARRQEKLEQERIRKEFEKDKAAAKARALREKKKDREAAEREVKKKKGLPLVRVRPSQDTIAWFVRGNGVGRKRDSGGRSLLAVEEEPEPVEEMATPSPRKSPVADLSQGDGETSESDAIKKRKVGSQEAHAIEREVPLQEVSQQKVPQEEVSQREASQREAPQREELQRETSQQEEPQQEAPIAWTMDLNDVEDVVYDGMEAQLTKAPTPRIDEEQSIEKQPVADRPKSPLRPSPSAAEIDEFPESLEDEFDFDMIMTRGKGVDDDKEFEEAPSPAESLTASSEPEAQAVAIEDLVEDFSDDIEFDIMEATTISAPGGLDVPGAPTPLDTMLPPPRPKSQREVNELDDEFGDEIEMEMLDDLDGIMNGNLDKPTSKNSKPHFKTPLIPNPEDGARSSWPRRRYEEDLGLQRPVDAPSSIPKNVPPKTTPRRPSPSPPPPPPRQAPPMSTQAILFNFDDFFPSPSQQARELDEEPFTQPSPILPRIPHSPTHPSQVDLEPDLEPAQSSSSPAPPPRRFFTSSGSHELMALAIQRSRRTAALEAIHQKDRARIEAGMVAQAEAQEKARLERLKAKNKPKAPVKTTPLPLKATPQKTNLPAKRDQISTNTTKTPPNQTSRPSNPPPKQPFVNKPPSPSTKRPTKHDKENQHNKENQTPTTSSDPAASQETEYGGDWVDDMALELMI